MLDSKSVLSSQFISVRSSYLHILCMSVPCEIHAVLHFAALAILGDEAALVTTYLIRSGSRLYHVMHTWVADGESGSQIRRMTVNL